MMDEKDAVEEMLCTQGYWVSTTVGWSMFPMLRNRRDSIVLYPVAGPIKKYDVVLYKNEGKYILHRVLKQYPDYFIIRGDNCYVKEKVPREQVFAVLGEFYRGDKKIDMQGLPYKIYARIWNWLYPVRLAVHKGRSRICYIGRRR